MSMERLRARSCIWAMRWLRATEHTSRSPRTRNRCDEWRLCCDSDLASQTQVAQFAEAATDQISAKISWLTQTVSRNECRCHRPRQRCTWIRRCPETLRRGKFENFDKPIWILTGCAFQDFARGSDVDSQLCVYVKGERVVDLWGSHGPNRDANYGPDSLQNIFSSGKSVASVCMARLVDKGLLDYNEKVSKYWPGICNLCHA